MMGCTAARAGTTKDGLAVSLEAKSELAWTPKAPDQKPEMKRAVDFNRAPHSSSARPSRHFDSGRGPSHRSGTWRRWPLVSAGSASSHFACGFSGALPMTSAALSEAYNCALRATFRIAEPSGVLQATRESGQGCGSTAHAAQVVSVRLQLSVFVAISGVVLAIPVSKPTALIPSCHRSKSPSVAARPRSRIAGQLSC